MKTSIGPSIINSQCVILSFKILSMIKGGGKEDPPPPPPRDTIPSGPRPK